MYLAAVRVTASVAETWAIVIVAVICLAFWLVMVVSIAPRVDARKRQEQQAMRVPFAGEAPVPGQGIRETRDDLPPVAGRRQPAPPARTPLPAQRQSATDEAAPSRRPDP